MDRLACVDVAALPLQLLLRAHPSWRRVPAAVVEDDRPQAAVLFLNAAAHRAGVRVGHRHAAALALAPQLHAGTIPPSRIARSVAALTRRLRRHSPRVEPDVETPGVFWLDASGLTRLFASLQSWAEAVRRDLQRAGVTGTVVVGFSRVGTYALARARRGVLVCADAAAERAALREVALACLDVDPDGGRRLRELGVRTVGDFLRLPADGIRLRFGDAADRLHRLAAGTRVEPFTPRPADPAYTREVDFDVPETKADRLVFLAKRVLAGLVGDLAHDGRAVAVLAWRFALDDRTTRTEVVRPAAPTLDAVRLLELVRLRFDALGLTAGVRALHVSVEACRAVAEERRLFAYQGRRDPDAIAPALARVRAAFGDESVVRARLRDAHLPSARFAWEPLDRAPPRAVPRVVAARPLVRRIRERPMPLAAGEGLQAARVSGPYVVSGGWWGGTDGVHRDYYFVHTRGRELRWLYYDRRRRRFVLEGSVE